MKLLLDENLPQLFRHELLGHHCHTVNYMGWNGIENGQLLALAASAGFDAFLTKDANLEYQQNLVNLPLSVVVLRAPSNRIDEIRPLIPALQAALATLPPRQLTVVPGN